MFDIELKSVDAFDGLLRRGGDARPAGVTVAERTGLALASVMVSKGKADDLSARMVNRFGCALPAPGRRETGSDLALVSTGPGAWLASRHGGGYEFSEEFGEALEGVASVTDQSDAFAVLRLSGRRVENVLAKGIYLDLHDDAFPVGHTAATQCGHVGVTLWRLANDGAGHPVYEIALFRSFAESFWHWLSLSAAEFGLAVEKAG